MSCHVMWCHVMWYHIISYRRLVYHIMSCDVMLRDLMEQEVKVGLKHDVLNIWISFIEFVGFIYLFLHLLNAQESVKVMMTKLKHWKILRKWLWITEIFKKLSYNRTVREKKTNTVNTQILWLLWRIDQFRCSYILKFSRRFIFYFILLSILLF